MYYLLILFFISILGITIMFGRKIILLRNGEIIEAPESEFIFDVDYLKKTSLKYLRKTLYITLFIILKSSIKTSVFFKRKSILIWNKIEAKMKKNKKEIIKEIKEQQEVSKYLKTISEYRKKINNMKSRIKEEEGVE